MGPVHGEGGEKGEGGKGFGRYMDIEQQKVPKTHTHTQ